MTYKKIIVAVFVTSAFLAPLSTSAVTIADLQAQVQSLLYTVSSLQQQVATRYGYNYTTPIVNTGTYYGTTNPWWCTTYADVSYGQRNNRVLALQQAMGVSILGAYPTGYYGQLTYNAWHRYCGTNYTTPIVGGDRDAHGCIGSAGYSWCASTNSCIRTWETSCPATVNPANDSNCQSWYDGCNSCSRSYRGGPATCTMRACYQQGQAYCTGYFGTTSNRPPTISSFSGPTTLNTNQTGTWTVRATDPDNGTLNYSVTWGDEYNYQYGLGAIYPTSNTFTQSTSFTHSYASAGTYTIRIVVRDSTGLEATTSTTVRVNYSTTACTMDYNPVCGQPQYTCPYGSSFCTTPTQKTYSNTCQMNADNATLIHYGACNQYYY